MAFGWLMGVTLAICGGCIYAASKGVDSPVVFGVMLLTMPPFSVGTCAFMIWARNKVDAEPPKQQPGPRAATRQVSVYGDGHQRERAKYEDQIRVSGGRCAERACVKKSRRIKAGAAWHLAHDHQLGGDAYLGPAHPECNEFEALQRGVKWDRTWTISRNKALRICDRQCLGPVATRTVEKALGLSRTEADERRYHAGLQRRY